MQVEIAVLGNTTCSKGDPQTPPTGCRDYRPLDADSPLPQLVYGKTARILLEGKGTALFENVSVEFRGSPMAEYWGSCVESVDGWMHHSSIGSISCKLNALW